MAEDAELKRPLGIKIFTVLYVFSFFDMVKTVNFFVFGHPAFHAMQGYLVVSLLFDGVFVVLGIGIFKLQEWARRGIIWTAIIATFYGVVAGFYSVPFLINMAKSQGLERNEVSGKLLSNASMGILSSLVMTLLVLWYFRLPRIKKLFRSGVKTD